jgi:uncharacterized membrane protein
VLVAILVYAVVIGGLSMYKHEVYGSSRFDLGNMDQAVWNSAQGRILEATDETGELTSRLRNHADFLLLAFVPLYWIHPSPHWLLVVQAAVVASGAWPLYALARRALKRDLPAALLAIAYLLNPGLQAANLFDFHAQMMAGTLLLFAFYYLVEKRFAPFVLFAALAAFTKEGTVLIVAMMGLYALFPLKRPRWGVPIFAAGVGYFLLVMLVLIPLFNAGEQSQLVEGRYEAFGGSLGGVARTALTDPVFTLRFVLAHGKTGYISELLDTTWYLGLLAPFVLMLPLPELAVNLLSDRPQMTDTNYHYSAPILPFFYVAAAMGLANLLRLLRWARGLKDHRRRPFAALARLVPGDGLLLKLPVLLTVGFLFIGAESDYRSGPLPGFRAPERGGSAVAAAPEPHRRVLDEALTRIPPDASVSASNVLGAQLAHRRYLYLFPTIRDAEYVIVDETEPAYDINVSPVPNLATVERLRRNPAYRIAYSKAGVTVFERVAP